MYRILFLDDRESESYLATFLEKEGLLAVEFRLVDQRLEDMASTVLEFKPDLVALDYRLDDEQGVDKVGVRYKAPPLAQQLREHAMENQADDFPIVLISQEGNLAALYQPDLTAHDLFDEAYAKGELPEKSSVIQNELLALVTGYRTIIAELHSDNRLGRMLGVAGDDVALSLLDNQEMRRWQGLKAPHQLAREVLSKVIRRNGLLLDFYSQLARLGVAKDSADLADLQECLSKEGVGYGGIFHEGWCRWWAHRLESIGEAICGDELGNLTAAQRVKCLNEKLGLQLVAAKSRWTDSDDFYPGFACASCGFSTEKIHSVVAYDPVPSFCETRRICWHCVQTGEYENVGLTIDDTDRYVVDKLQSGQIQKGH